MEYVQFTNRIAGYQELYEKGLKKRANAYMLDFVKKIQQSDAVNKDELLYRFTEALCDKKEFEEMKKRGNGAIPYALAQCLREWLQERCVAGKMPELRWYYELFWNDNIGHEFAFGFLKKAYESEACDLKTVNLLFDVYLDTLGWGVHHFPEGCIITRETREEAFENCRKILSEKIVDERLLAWLKYYEVLYSCYDAYVQEGRTKEFSLYCKESNIAFFESRAYYYEK